MKINQANFALSIESLGTLKPAKAAEASTILARSLINRDVASPFFKDYPGGKDDKGVARPEREALAYSVEKGAALAALVDKAIGKFFDGAAPCAHSARIKAAKAAPTPAEAAALLVKAGMLTPEAAAAMLAPKVAEHVE